MKLLILGSDGRAHALVWKLFNSPQVTTLLCEPGNGGTTQLAPPAELGSDDPAQVARWAFDHSTDCIIPAESVWLHHGLVDEAAGFQVGVFGPTLQSTIFERSRCAAKAFMLRYKLPTAPGRPFSELATAEKFLATAPMPVIIKADNPTLGEAVYEERYAAISGLHTLFNTRPLGGQNNGVVIESLVRGSRIVMSAITDGQTTVPLLPARFYDHLAENESGPQAPGIGAHTSDSRYAELLGKYLHQHILLPIVAGMAQESMPYRGIISIDCLIAADGPKLTAIRTMFHEGEAQVVLPRLEDDLLPWLHGAITQRLHELPAPRFTSGASVGLGLVALGHPHYSAVGGPISGLENLDQGVLVFHSATERTNPRPIATPFGSMFSAREIAPAVLRVRGSHPLTLVATAPSLSAARERAIANAERIQFEGRVFRESIGLGWSNGVFE